MKHFFSKFFGTVNERKLKEMQPRVDIVNSFEGEFKKLTGRNKDFFKYFFVDK